MKSFRYYSTQRPVAPGTFPKPEGNRVLAIENFDKRTICRDARCEAWGYIDYEKPLDEATARSYELVKQIYPLYIRHGEYVGVFQYEESAGIPIYRFDGGDCAGMDWPTGSNDRKELQKEAEKCRL